GPDGSSRGPTRGPGRPAPALPRARGRPGSGPGTPRSTAGRPAPWSAAASPPRPRSRTGRRSAARAGHADDGGTRPAAGGGGRPRSHADHTGARHRQMGRAPNGPIRSPPRRDDGGLLCDLLVVGRALAGIGTAVDPLDVRADAAQLLVDA